MAYIQYGELLLYGSLEECHLSVSVASLPPTLSQKAQLDLDYQHISYLYIALYELYVIKGNFPEKYPLKTFSVGVVCPLQDTTVVIGKALCGNCKLYPTLLTCLVERSITWTKKITLLHVLN